MQSLKDLMTTYVHSCNMNAMGHMGKSLRTNLCVFENVWFVKGFEENSYTIGDFSMHAAIGINTLVELN